MEFFKKRKFCLPALVVLVIMPLISNILFFSKEHIEFTFINLLKYNFSEPLLIIVSMLSFLIAFTLCSIKNLQETINVKDEIEKATTPFKRLLDNAPAAVIATDNKGKVEYINKAFEEMTGYTKKELIGKKYAYNFYKGGKETAKKVIKAMRSTDYGGIGKVVGYEIDAVTRYDEYIPCLIYGNINYVEEKETGSIGFLVDMRDRIKILKELEKSRNKYKTLIESAGEGIYIRQDHQFKYFNKKFKEMLGYHDDEEIKSIPIYDVIDESAFKKCSMMYDKILNGEVVKAPYESIFKKKDGSRIFVEVNINPVIFEGKPAVQGFVRDITEKKLLENQLKEMNEKLLALSIQDELTGLYNYRYFRERIKEKFLESKRYNIPLSLLVIDIDDFKQVNDVYGHLAGDMILKGVAKILMRNVREVDIAARYGGEEFAILLTHVDIEKAKSIGERILHDISSKEFLYDIHLIKITVSIGVSCFNKEFVKSEEDLIKFADEAMYFVKNSGKNNIKVMEFSTIN